MANTGNYVYLPVRDAIRALNQKVNLMGVILEYGLPEKSRGPDWFCTLKITDESYQGHSLSVIVFAEQPDLLPHVKSAGDIICFSRVMMKASQGSVKAFFNKKVSAFALFEGKFGKTFIPYQALSKYGQMHCDPDLTLLRTWLLNWQIDSGASESIVPLKQICAGKWFDLICKVIKVHEVSKDAWVLYLWDGTDAPPLSCCTNLNEEVDNPIPLCLEMSELPREVLCEFPNAGTVLRVILDQNTKDLALSLPCTWVKFIDFVCEERLGLWCGILSSSTKTRILSDEDLIVKHRKRSYEERLISKWDCMPCSAIGFPPRLTETCHKYVPFTTLMGVLTHSEVTAKFKCIVRVVAICPARVEDFCSPLEEGLYRMRLTLEDPTARIRAYLYGEDGDKYFGGHSTEDEMTHKVNKLLGITEEDSMQCMGARRNPPWIEVCLLSYYLEKDNPWETRKYRIFGTTLKV